MSKFVKTARRFAKSAGKKVVKGLKKRYVTKTGKGLRVGQIVSDVAMLKRMVNAEKKRVTTGINNTSVAQVNGNTSGLAIYDITPVMSEGVTYSTRNGSSIKWTSGYAQFQFIHQSATQSAIKGAIYVIKVKNQVITGQTCTQTFLNPSPFISSTSIYDYNSTRNVDYFKDFQVLKRKNFTVKCDQLSGQTVQTVIKMPLKFGHHVKFSGDTNTVTDGQVFILILCDSGNNNGASTSTVGNVSVTAPNTGLNLCWSMTNYYIDN